MALLEALLPLAQALGDEVVVLGLLVLLLLDVQLLHAPVVTLALQALGSNKTLDLGSLGVRLGTLLLRLDGTANHVLAHIVLLRKVEELADVCGVSES